MNDRERRALNLCRRLSREVGAIAPAGLGLHDEAWEMVATSTDVFLDLLAAWQRGERSVVDVGVAYNAVLDAWREAAAVIPQEISIGLTEYEKTDPT